MQSSGQLHDSGLEDTSANLHTPDVIKIEADSDFEEKSETIPHPKSPTNSVPMQTFDCDDTVRVRQETPDSPALTFDAYIREESMTPPRLYFDDEIHTETRAKSVHIREESVTPPPLHFDDDSIPVSEATTSRKRKADEMNISGGDIRTNGEDSWEEELDETLIPNVEIQDWNTLRTQIKKDLKKGHKSLPLSQINQLMILRNFATLRLKGYSRIDASFEIARQWQEKEGSNIHFARRVRALARRYQIFEQLPRERRGGYKNARSLLKDETVRTASRAWLTEQPVGSITPNAFMHALNTIILPSIGISPSKPLCERTARRWLVKLGWTRTTIRKGVYMDGHERPDVVEYRDKVFLPKMKEFERRMARYEGPEMKRVEPTLLPGEKELIAEFQDETCFQGNDFKSSAWFETSFSF